MSNFGIGNFQSDEACDLIHGVVQKQFINRAFELIDAGPDASDSFEEQETMALLEAAIIVLERVGTPKIDAKVVAAYREKALRKWDATCAELWFDEPGPSRRRMVEMTFERLELMLLRDDHWT